MKTEQVFESLKKMIQKEEFDKFNKLVEPQLELQNKFPYLSMFDIQTICSNPNSSLADVEEDLTAEEFNEFITIINSLQ